MKKLGFTQTFLLNTKCRVGSGLYVVKFSSKLAAPFRSFMGTPVILDTTSSSSTSTTPHYGARARAGSYRTPPVCHGVLSDSPLCRASRGTSECRASGVGPTVTRDTQGESCRTQPWPWPRNLCHILQNCAALRAALKLPCCAALRAALRLRNSAVLRTAGPVIYRFSTFRLAV